MHLVTSPSSIDQTCCHQALSKHRPDLLTRRPGPQLTNTPCSSSSTLASACSSTKVAHVASEEAAASSPASSAPVALDVPDGDAYVDIRHAGAGAQQPTQPRRHPTHSSPKYALAGVASKGAREPAVRR